MRDENLIEALSKIYYVIYDIDLQQNAYQELTSTDQVRKWISASGTAEELFRIIHNNLCMPEYRPGFGLFYNLDTLENRLRGKNIITYEYVGVTVGWVEVGLIPVSYDAAGKLDRVLFVARDISAVREKNSKYMNMIQALASSYENLYSINLRDGMVEVYSFADNIRESYGSAIDSMKYEGALSLYINTEVHKDDIPLFSNIRTLEGCRKILEKSKEYAFVYRVIRGGEVHYFKCQILKPLDERDEFVLGFYNVDEDILAQNRQKRELEHRMDIIQSIGNIYTSSYFIDLEKDSFEELSALEPVHKVIGASGKAQERMDFFVSNIVESGYQNEMREFMDLKTLRERLEGKNMISCEFFGKIAGWAECAFIPVIRTNTHEINQVLFATRGINDQKKKELQNQQELEEQIAVTAGLAADYYSVMLVDYQNDTVSIREAREADGKQIAEFFSSYPTWSEGARAYTDTQVVESEKEEIYNAVSLEGIRSRTEDYSFNYQKVTEDGIVHLQFKVAYVKTKEGHRFAVVGTRNVEKEFQNQIQLQKAQAELATRYSMIIGLSQEYHTVWLCPNSGENMQLFRSTGVGTIQNAVDMGHTNVRFNDAMKSYIDAYVDEVDRERVWNACRFETVLKETPEKNLYTVNYLRHTDDGNTGYHQMAFARATKEDGSYDIILGYRDIDALVKEEQEKQRVLRDALASAEHANRAKTTFLSNMSHDIRTPMNAIMGFTTLAMTHIGNQEMVKDYLGKISTSSNHLLSLINDVLDMSRIESGRMHLEEVECNLSDILHDLRNILLSDLKAKSLNFFIDTVDVFDEEVVCDKLRLNQIMLNILGNAMKFTQPGGSISVRLIEKPAAKKEYGIYEFHVKDTGIGMSEEFTKHIFEPFERERNSTVSGIQGTGLGMAITKNIVDMMNGTIEVKSEKGVGSEFIISLPMKKIDTEPKNFLIEELENAHALVVDDDFNTCDSVTNMLIQMGMRADWSMSGKESVLRCRQAIQRHDPYRVYVIDWLIPDMNGIEVARNIRREVGDDAPIIILTSYDWGDIEQEAKDAGVTAFVSKPLFISDIRRCLMNILHPSTKEAEEIPGYNAERIMGKHILLVEDNDLNREIATELLSAAGLLMEEAWDGTVALKMLKEKGAGYYDLVLMDIQMPIMDGYTAAREIRGMEDPALAGIPIIAMTANAFDEDKKKAFEAGMNGHVAKPINLEKLLAMLDSVL